jgi:hypothetical protein
LESRVNLSLRAFFSQKQRMMSLPSVAGNFRLAYDWRCIYYAAIVGATSHDRSWRAFHILI